MEGKPRVYESAVIPAPRQQVWQKIRDFNALPAWHPAIAKSELEGGDCVGCVRHSECVNENETPRSRI